jgi:hypothetical protein
MDLIVVLALLRGHMGHTLVCQPVGYLERQLAVCLGNRVIKALLSWLFMLTHYS